MPKKKFLVFSFQCSAQNSLISADSAALREESPILVSSFLVFQSALLTQREGHTKAEDVLRRVE